MKTQIASIDGVIVIEPQLFADARGFFLETYHEAKFIHVGIAERFVQDCHSRSRRGTLRGLHYQIDRPQGKLVSIVRGEVFDVAVDLRRNSPSFGQWTGRLLSDANHLQLYIPAGCAHGFCVTSDVADVVYKCTDLYCPESERTIAWNDPQLAIDWPVDNPLLSAKDRHGLSFAHAPYFESTGRPSMS